MSEIKLAEFRERAERGLGVPDLDDLERRGRSLRRRRAAAGVGALALAVAAVAGIANVASGGPDASQAPAGDPSPTPSSGLSFVSDGPEDLLALGPAWTTYNEDGKGGRSAVTVRFDVVDPDWEWFGLGMGLRTSPEAMDDYAASIFFLRNPVARLRPCSVERMQALGTDPETLLANVAPLLELVHTTVLEQPRVVRAFGHPAVHLRLRTGGGCIGAIDLPAQLGEDLPGSIVGPSWDGEGEQVLDVWHILLPGEAPSSMLVASWEHVGATSKDLTDRQEMLSSVRIDVE